MKNIFIIGDSISVHYGPFLQKFLNGVAQYRRKEGMEQALQNLDIPEGTNGGDSSMVLNYFKAKKYKSPISADLILFNCGLHDVKTNPESKTKQVSLELYKKNLQGILTEISAISAQPVWIRTTPCNDEIHNCRPVGFHRHAVDVEAYNTAADSIMEDADVPSIDLYNFTLTHLSRDPGILSNSHAFS